MSTSGATVSATGIPGLLMAAKYSPGSVSVVPRKYRGLPCRVFPTAACHRTNASQGCDVTRRLPRSRTRGEPNGSTVYWWYPPPNYSQWASTERDVSEVAVTSEELPRACLRLWRNIYTRWPSGEWDKAARVGKASTLSNALSHRVCLLAFNRKRLAQSKVTHWYTESPCGYFKRRNGVSKLNASPLGVSGVAG